MPRPVAVMALGLMLLTGLVIGQLHTVGVQRTPLSAPIRTGEEVARRFYDGINYYLAGGKPDLFLNQLDPDFVDRANPPGSDGSAESLRRYLSSLRSTFPDLRFAVIDVVAQGESVAVDLSLTGNLLGTFLNVDVSARGATGGFELLRITNYKIAERWGSKDLPPMYETVTESVLPNEAGWNIAPRIERHRLDPSAEIEVELPQGVGLVVETGTLGIAVDKPFISSQADRPANGPLMLEPGELLLAPTTSLYLLSNPGKVPASLLLVAMRRISPVAAYPPVAQATPTPGHTVDVLASGGKLPSYDGPYVISLGRAFLPPGVEIPMHIVAEAELLLVTKGSIDVSTSDGQVWIGGSGDRPMRVQIDATLSAGDGLSAYSGSDIRYRVAGPEPVEFWFVTVAPHS